MALVRCPDCNRDVSDAAPACPGCGRPMVASAPAQPPKPKQEVVTGKQTLAVVIGAVVLFGAVLYFHDGSASTLAVPAPPPAPTTPPQLQVGEIGVLHSFDEQAPVYLFENRADFDEFQKSVVAKDLTGANQALAHCTTVISGTRARAIENDWWQGAVRVRVENGPHAQFAGWTSSPGLRKN